MFAKTSVKDAGGSAVFDALAKATGERPKWNFHKYLVARDGKTAVSFPSKVDPESKEFVAEGRGAAGAPLDPHVVLRGPVSAGIAGIPAPS
jgi:glutathione peroxidase